MLTGLEQETNEGGDWRRVAFRGEFRNGILERQEDGVVRISWTTLTEDLDGDPRHIRASGQFVQHDDGTLLRDGAWLSWDEEREVLIVAEYDYGSIRQVIVYRDGVEEVRPLDPAPESDRGLPVESSFCKAFKGIESAAETTLKAIKRNTAAIRARRRETAEAEARPAAMVQLRRIQQERAMAQQMAAAAMWASMFGVCHPSRGQMIGDCRGCAGAESSGWSVPYFGETPTGTPVFTSQMVPIPVATSGDSRQRSRSPHPGPRLQP